MDSKSRIEKFLEAMETDEGYYRGPKTTAEEMGLSWRELSEATGERLSREYKKYARALANQMMELNIGDPFVNEMAAHYIAHMNFAQRVADILKSNPDVNFGRIKFAAKKTLKENRKLVKKEIKRWREVRQHLNQS